MAVAAWQWPTTFNIPSVGGVLALANLNGIAGPAMLSCCRFAPPTLSLLDNGVRVPHDLLQGGGLRTGGGVPGELVPPG